MNVFTISSGNKRGLLADLSGIDSVYDEEDDEYSHKDLSNWNIEDVKNYFTSIGCRKHVDKFLVGKRKIHSVDAILENSKNILDIISKLNDDDLTKKVTEHLHYLAVVSQRKEGRVLGKVFQFVHDYKIYRGRYSIWESMGPKILVEYILSLIGIERMKEFFFRKYVSKSESAIPEEIRLLFCSQKTKFFYALSFSLPVVSKISKKSEISENDIFLTFSESSLSLPLYIQKPQLQDLSKSLESKNVFVIDGNEDEEEGEEEEEKSKKVKKKVKLKRSSTYTLVTSEKFAGSDFDENYTVTREQKLDTAQEFRVLNYDGSKKNFLLMKEKGDFLNLLCKTLVRVNSRESRKRGWKSEDFMIFVLSSLGVKADEISKIKKVIKRVPKSLPMFSKLL